jgi:hypothetical protein
VDVSSNAWFALAVSSVLTMVGVVGIGFAFVSHGPLAHRPWIPTLGGACMVSGPLSAIIALRGLLKADEYVAVLEGGLLLFVAGSERYVVWGDVSRVSWRSGEPGALEIAVRGGEPIVIARTFARIRGEELAARLEDFRRKAEFDLIR